MTDDLYDITVSYPEADIRQIASWTRPSPFAEACRAKVAELDAARVPVPEKGTRWRNSDDGWVADFTTGIRISSEGMLTHQSAWPLDGSPGIYLSPDWQERWSEIPPRGCPEIGEVWELTTRDGRTKRGTVDGYKRGDHGWRVVLTGPGAPITGISLYPDGSLRCPDDWHRVDPEPEPAEGKCQWVNAEGKLWVCRVCGSPVIVNVSKTGRPRDRKCSGEFGRFNNVTSRECEASLVELRPEPEPARPEWALWTVDTPDGPAARDSNRVMVLAGHLKVGDVILWPYGEWLPVEKINEHRYSSGVVFQHIAPAVPVVVRVGEDQ